MDSLSQCNPVSKQAILAWNRLPGGIFCVSLRQPLSHDKGRKVREKRAIGAKAWGPFAGEV